MRLSHQSYLLILAILFAVVWIWLAISPHDRADWTLENVLVVLFTISIAATYQRFPFSRISYTLIFLFLVFHEIGAHYTYAKVPYNEWTQQIFGFRLNDVLGFERNHFDRLIHFSYGLLILSGKFLFGLPM